jgi:hypothetical protein
LKVYQEGRVHQATKIWKVSNLYERIQVPQIDINTKPNLHHRHQNYQVKKGKNRLNPSTKIPIIIIGKVNTRHKQ